MSAPFGSTAPPPDVVAEAFAAMLAIGEEQGHAEADLAALVERLTLEELATAAEFGGLPASPAQLALLRAADGRGLGGVLDDEVGVDGRPADEYHFNVGAAALGIRRPRYVIVRGGVRSGKSLIAAFAMVLSALRCTLRRPPEQGELAGPDGLVGVRPGEFVRVVVVAPQKSLTRAAFTHAASLMQQSRALRPLLESDPLKESFTIRRPDGALIEVMIVAASGAGATLRSTWLAGVFFDEADFHRDGEAVVNLDDNFKSVKARLLPNAQAWIVSSPWCEDTSFDKLFRDAFGKPGRELAFHSDSRAMNPTLDREEEEAERAKDPDNAAREYDAIPTNIASNAFFPADALALCVNKARAIELPPNGKAHKAGADMGFRRNSSAIAFARPECGKVILAYYQELRPTKGAPLKPPEVCEQFAANCNAYDARMVLGDLHYADTTHGEFAKHRAQSALDHDPWAPTYTEYDTREHVETATAFLALMREGKLDLPNDPRLLNQARGVRRVLKPGGVVGIKFPNQSAAHADLFMAVMLACVQVEQIDEAPRNDVDAESLLDAPRWGSGRGFG